MLAGLPEQVGPHDRAALAPAPLTGLQALESQQPDVLAGDAEVVEERERRVGRVGLHVGGDERAAAPVAGVAARDVEAPGSEPMRFAARSMTGAAPKTRRCNIPRRP